jgi:hypothetical protein
LPHPAAHRLAGDFQLAGDLRLRHALAEQPEPLRLAPLQRLKIPSLPRGLPARI